MNIDLSIEDLLKLAVNGKFEKDDVTITYSRPVLAEVAGDLNAKTAKVLFYLDEHDERRFSAFAAKPDPIPDDVRQFLKKNFADVHDEPAEGDYYVFSLKNNQGQPRTLKVHRNLFIYSELVTDYLKQHGFVDQLERGNMEITKPLP